MFISKLKHNLLTYKHLKLNKPLITRLVLVSILLASNQLYVYAADTACENPTAGNWNNNPAFPVAYSSCSATILFGDGYVRLQQQSATSADCGVSTGGFPTSPPTNNRGGFISQTCGTWSDSTQRCTAFSGDINLANVGDYCAAVRTDLGEEVIVHASWNGTTFASVGALYRDILSVTGNNITIANGDSSPQATDNTDFGNVEINSSKTHTFVLTNNSSQTITLNSINLTTVGTQSNATPFLDKVMAALNPIETAWAAVSSVFTRLSPSGAVSIAAGATQSFTLQFAPTATGLQQAQVDLEAGNGAAYSFIIQGTGISPAPVANNNTGGFNKNEDAAAFTINSADLLMDDTGDTLSIQSVTAITGGTVVLSADKTTITFTPAANFNGTAKFTYTVVDSIGRTASAEVTGTIAPVDDAPTVSNPPTAVTVNEDAANSNIDLSSVFTDTESDPITLSIVSNSNAGLVTPTLTGKTLALAYTPNQSGTATLTIRATANGKTVDTMLTVTVNPVDDAPVVSTSPTAVTVNEDAANSSIDLSNVFTDTEGDPITLSILSNSNTGLVSPTLTGKTLTLAYTPNQSGTATITIRATANGKTVDTTLTVTVNPVDDAPIVSTPLPDVTVAEGAANSVLDLTNTFTDVDSAAISLSVFSNDNSALVTPTLAGKTLTLAYAPNQSGTARLTIRATANGKTVDLPLVVTVNPVDDAPVVNTPIPPVTVNEDDANTVVDLSNTFRDPDGSTLSLSILSNDNSTLVTPTLNGSRLTLAYAANQNGNARIVIRATADGKAVDTPLVLTVNPVDDAPVVNTPIPAVSVNEDAPNSLIDLSTAFKDTENDAISLSVLSNSNETLVKATLDGNNLKLVYTPNQSGNATIVIRATANGKTVDTFVQVRVKAKQGLQVSANSQMIPNGDTTPSNNDCTDFGSIKVSGESKACTYTITNLDSTAITAVITQTDLTSSANLLSWPTLKQVFNSMNPISAAWAVGFADFTASTNSITVPANGTASFSIIFDPSTAGLRESLVSLSVSGRVAHSFRIAGTGVASASPPTVAKPIASIIVNENTPNTIVNLDGAFTDPDNQAITLSIVSNTNSSLVTPTLNGTTLTLAYAPNQTGSATITIRATAADGETVETSFTVTIKAVTAIPIFSPFGLLALLASLAWFGWRRKA